MNLLANHEVEYMKSVKRVINSRIRGSKIESISPPFQNKVKIQVRKRTKSTEYPESEPFLIEPTEMTTSILSNGVSIIGVWKV